MSNKARPYWFAREGIVSKNGRFQDIPTCVSPQPYRPSFSILGSYDQSRSQPEDARRLEWNTKQAKWKILSSLAALIGSLLRPAGGHQRGPAAGVRRGGPRPGQACARAGGRADPRRGYQRGSGWDGVKRSFIFPILVAARWSGGAWV